MKKKFLLIILLYLSIFNIKIVDAKVSDVSIKNIEMIEKTGNTEIISDATFYGMNINYDIIFKEVNDSIKYKITIINKGNEDIYINNKGEIGGSDYIVYDYIWDDNQNIIKANSEKTFELAITYKSQVEAKKLSSGKYVEAKDLVIRISDQKGNTLPVKNPHTDSNLSMFIILFSIEILMVMAVTVYLIKNKKLNIKKIKQMKKANMISAGVFLVLVLGTIIGYSYCLDATEIVLNSTVKVSKARLARSCSSDSYTLDHPYDNSRTMYEERGDNFPFANEGKVIATGIDENDFCIDWTLEFEKIYDYLVEEKAIDFQSIEESGNNGLVGMMHLDPRSFLSMNETLATQFEDAYYPPVYSVVTTTTSKLPDTCNYDGKIYELLDKTDVSDIQNGDVMLGFYKSTVDDSILALIGEDGGVLAPVDSSWLFGVLDRKNIYGSNELDVFQGLGYDLDNIKESQLNTLIGIDRIIDKSKVQLMFKRNIQIGPMIVFNDFDLENIDFSDTNNMSGMFAGSGLENEGWRLRGLKKWDTSNVKDMSGMFLGVGIKNAVVNSGRSSIQNNVIVEGIETLNTSNVENMILMFAGAFNSLQSLNISNWNTSKVKDMAGMFLFGLNSVNNLDLSRWDVSNVEDLSGTFLYSLENADNVNLSTWNTSKVKYMTGTFALSLQSVEGFNIKNWNTSNVENMTAMFTYSLNNVKSFNVSNWNTSKVKYMTGTFALSLYNVDKLDLSNWDVTNVKDMRAMFRESLANASELNLSNWNPKEDTLKESMFHDLFEGYNDYARDSMAPQLYVNKIDFTKTEDYNNIFRNMPFTILYVKNKDNQNWILNLEGEDRPDFWTKDNIIVR